MAPVEIDICYIVSHGFAARMILHAGVIPRLRELGRTVAIVSPDGDEPGMREAAERLGFHTRAAPAEATAVERFAFKQMQRYLFDDIPRNPALWAKHLRQRNDAGGRPVEKALPVALLGANRLAREFRPASAALRTARKQLVRNREAARILAELQPRMVVSTYPVSMLEASFLLEARRAGIPTTCQLLSWDNITCKGQFPVLADEYIVWGPIMAHELEDYYQVPRARIHECGVAHFDAHLDPKVHGRRHAALTALKLDPDRPYIFQGMSSPYFAPHEIDIVEWLARAVDAGEFGDDMQLVVRPHPQNIQGDMADRAWLPRLDAIASDRVAIDYPRLRPSKLAWSMDEGDLPHLAGLLAGCAMCLNSCSTLSIDAIMHDRPVVITAFDADFQLSWWRSARRALDYLHIAKFIELGGVRVAHSFSDLERWIRRYIADPTLDSAGREHARSQECGTCDGRASIRIADTLHQLLESRAPRIAHYHRDVERAPRPETPDQPLVSIVTVVWNGEHFLEDAIRSVAGQDYPHIEYIVVDGGSTDGTLDIIERYRDRVDVLISEPDDGIYDAMNKGIAVSRGQLIKLLNADDRLLPGSVSAAVREYLGTDSGHAGPAAPDSRPAPAAVVIKSDLEYVDHEGKVLKRIGARRAVNPVGAVLHPSWYVDRRLYEQHGLYDTGFRVSADYEMFVRLHHHQVQFRHCPTPLVEFRSGGVSGTMTGVFERYAINRRYFSRRVAARTFAMHAYKKLRARMLARVLGEERMYQVRHLMNQALRIRD